MQLNFIICVATSCYSSRNAPVWMTRVQIYMTLALTLSLGVNRPFDRNAMCLTADIDAWFIMLLKALQRSITVKTHLHDQYLARRCVISSKLLRLKIQGVVVCR